MLLGQRGKKEDFGTAECFSAFEKYTQTFYNGIVQ